MKLSRIAIALPFVLLSCGDNPDAPEMNAGTISFDIADIHLQENSTRVAILDIDGLKNTGFRVNAYSTGAADWQTAGSAAKPEFMHDRPVMWDNGGWVCTPAKYWPEKMDGVNYGKVSFFAWNDLKGVTVSGKDETGPPRLTCTVPNTCTAQEDLVTAMLTNKTKAGGNVRFTFGHAFSRIGFTAGLKGYYPGAEIKITSLKVTYAAGAVGSTGVYTFGDTGQAAGTWAFPASGKTYMSDVSSGGDEVMTGSVTPDDTSTVRLNSEDRYLMLLPQTVGEGAVRMDVTWTVNDGTTLTYRQTIGLPGQVWLSGIHYDYNMTVSPTGITLDPVVVNPWDDNPVLTPCILTYIAGDGTGNEVIEYRTTGVPYPLAENMFQRQDYIFVGWNTLLGDWEDRYQPGDLYLCTMDTRLYACWVPSSIIR
jgi:hypothetical protein